MIILTQSWKFTVGAVTLFILSSFSPIILAASNAVLQINTITIPGKRLAPPYPERLNLRPLPEETVFYFSPAPHPEHTPLRIRCRLEGYEETWHEGGGEMYLIIRFYNQSGDSIHQVKYTVSGTSTGWTGSLKTSPLVHRRETLVAPPHAASVMVVLSSAGPPSTIGIYAVQGLTISKCDAKGEIILPTPLSSAVETAADTIPQGMERDGTRPTMAKFMEVGNRCARAFAIVDDDPVGHAEWHNDKLAGPRVTPNDLLVLEWNEMFSMGVSDFSVMGYQNLKSGSYRFRLSELSVLGTPVGPEAVVALRIPPPYWQTPWFWSAAAAFMVVMSVLTFRYFSWRRMRHAMASLQQQHALEQERLRIAQDIHDDLGARITQISIVSGMAQKDADVSDKARAELDRISSMSRELVSALYETIWAVNPSNDNVEAVGTYLCQRINELCVQAGLRCRLNVSSLPQDVEISSRVRHNLSMAANEAVHNVIKHAKATLVTVKITFENDLLVVVISDDGCGFQAETLSNGGYGLSNIHRRMRDIGGTCEVRNGHGKGTAIHLQLGFKSTRPPLKAFSRSGEANSL